MKIKRALISVSDKTGVVEFGQGLAALGVEILSTGGTAKTLLEAGVPVKRVSEVTGFPEILDGRVKTLHPKVHGGILALRTGEHMRQLAQHSIIPIDLVVVNLYPFQTTVASPGVSLEEAIENIDIGGPAMVRSAAKNYRYVLVVVKPCRYKEILAVLESNEIKESLRLELALEAFAHTASYDTAIASYLQKQLIDQEELFLPNWHLAMKRAYVLRYGENPHQRAAFYRDPTVSGPCVGNAFQLSGKELSFNNILDLNAALELVREFSEPAAVIIKHNNPCGAACADNLSEAYLKAYEADPVSAFGGIVALNKIVDKDTAEEMIKIFLEAIIAPDFQPQALEILVRRAGLRILKAGNLDKHYDDQLDIRKVGGGLLIQESDRKVLNPIELKVVTTRVPTEEEMAELIFAMTVVKHVKSNAIVVSKNRQILGVGAGQMNRVGSAKIALAQAKEAARGAVLASDAFFPFRDTVVESGRAGIAAIIQPGGSMRDEESIEAANEYGMAMVFTGLRHFKH